MSQKNTVLLSIIGLPILMSAFLTQAAPTSIGIGASWTDAPYKGYGAVYYPLPHITFDNDILFINNFTAGAYIYNEDNQKVSIGISYLPLQFRPKDTDDRQLKQLDKRRSTLLAEVKYAISTTYGSFSASIGGDILNESNSILVGASYSYRFSGDKWAIIPRIGVNWANGKNNNYYYGVTHTESARSGLSYYKAKSAFTPFVSLTGTYALTQNFATYAGFRIDQLTGDIKDSPMIANSTVPSIFAGISYSF